MILQECVSALPRIETMQWAGRVRDLVGLLVASDGPAAAVGDFCEILSASGKPVRAQVVGFRDGRVLLMPLEETGGLQAGDKVVARAGAARVEVSRQLLGRVLDGFGQPMDDVRVIALIGERNREVREFLDNELTAEGLKRSVVVAATSDTPAPLRVRAVFVALAVAEYFRDGGKSVLLVMDSVTRLAMAQREIGLAAGEPPSQKGYTPSVFNMLPRVFERAGKFRRGSITGFFTVLVEGDDFNEPIADAVRSILDGHIVLSRDLGAAGRYPAFDILNWVSRLTSDLARKEQKEAMATYHRTEDLIQLGAYVSGTSPQVDAAVRVRQSMEDFLKQAADAKVPLPETLKR